MNILLIAAGGALGSVARYLIVVGTNRLAGTGFPYGTLTVNVIGSFLMGVAVAVLIDRFGSDAPSRWLPLVTTGFLGGFTTFSAFSIDAYMLLEDGRFGAMLGYVAASVLISLLALAVGITVTRVGLI